MKKNNNKGFVLAETLIVTVFLMYIFSMIYANFYPLMGEYEKRENYDNIDGKYTAYWVKRIIEDADYTQNMNSLEIEGKPYVKFDCQNINYNAADKRSMCARLMKELEVKDCNDNGTNCKIYITKYNLETFQSEIASGNYDKGFKEYVNYLPQYKYESQNGAKYRVIVVMQNKKNGNNYKSYATIEVKK